MTNRIDVMATIKGHIEKHGAISTRDAARYYGISGGTTTKYISILRRSQMRLATVFLKDEINGRRFANYVLVAGDDASQ